jgi:hypothetical protein
VAPANVFGATERTGRIDATDWDVSTSFNRTEPLLVEVEKQLRPRNGLLEVKARPLKRAATTSAPLEPFSAKACPKNLGKFSRRNFSFS